MNHTILEAYNEKKLFQKYISKKLVSYWPIILIFLIYTIIFSFFLILRYNSFQSEYYDFGLQLYSLNSASKNFKEVIPLILPTNESLIGHLNPFMLILLPLYILWANPFNLLILTSIALGSSVFPFFLLAKNHLKNKKNAIILSVIYLINPLFHNSNRFDFHLITFVPLFVLGAIYFYEKQNMLGFTVLILLANTTHEFMTIVTCSMALSLLIKEYKNKKQKPENYSKENNRIRTILIVFVIGAIWFLVASIIQGFFNPSTSITNWATFGGAQTSQLPQKIIYFIQMFAPLLFLPILEIIWLIPVLPYILVVLTSNHPGYWTIYYQYGAFTAPFLFYCLIKVVKRFQVHQTGILTKKRIKKILLFLLISNLIFSISFSSLSPFSEFNWSNVSKHDQTLKNLIEKIPKNSSVITQSQIYTHLADRDEVALYYSDFNLRGRIIDYYPDFLVFDVTQNSFYIPTYLYGFPDNKSMPLSKSVYKTITETNYQMASAADGAYIFSRSSKETLFDDNLKGILFDIDERWTIDGNYRKIPFGLSIIGNQGSGAVFYNPKFTVQSESYSLSYGIQTTKSYGIDSWSGVIFGYKDKDNYLCLCLRYPGGFLSLIQLKNGSAEDRVIGSIAYPSEDYQYFYLKIDENQLQVYVNSYEIAKIKLDSNDLKGQIGYSNWQQDTNIILLLLTEN